MRGKATSISKHPEFCLPLIITKLKNLWVMTMVFTRGYQIPRPASRKRRKNLFIPTPMEPKPESSPHRHFPPSPLLFDK